VGELAAEMAEAGPQQALADLGPLAPIQPTGPSAIPPLNLAV
jgi:hypothetical protein